MWKHKSTFQTNNSVRGLITTRHFKVVLSRSQITKTFERGDDSAWDFAQRTGITVGIGGWTWATYIDQSLATVANTSDLAVAE